MAEFFYTEHFILESQDNPFVSRADGGHLRIRVKDRSITDRTKLSPSVAVEFMRLSMLAGEALETVMNKRGVPVVKVNYQDMGNWAWKKGEKPFLHIHIFGRSEDAKHQKFPEAVYLPDRLSGFYDGFEPLSEEDIKEIQEEMASLEKTEKYNQDAWRLASFE
jgi:diadenosine tetraphosphate (Ap4A) HIT family hydrolase